MRMFRFGGYGGLEEGGKGHLRARAALAKKARCSLGMAEEGGGQSASSYHLSASLDSMIWRLGLGVCLSRGGSEVEPGGSRVGRPRPARGPTAE